MITQGSETSQYLQEKRTRVYSPSSGERKGKSLNLYRVRLIWIVIRVAMIEDLKSQVATRAVWVLQELMGVVASTPRSQKILF